MNLTDIKRIEEIFRNSKSPDELFDAFQDAIKLNLSDIDTYKILIANPILTLNEIKMFTEKLLKEMPENTFDLLLWAGKILESHPENYSHLDETISIYQRAILQRPTSHEPLLRLIKLYNHEINLPANQKIVSLIDESLAAVNRKSNVYYALASHYKKCGDLKTEKKYLRLAEESVKKECDD